MRDFNKIIEIENAILKKIEEKKEKSKGEIKTAFEACYTIANLGFIDYSNISDKTQEINLKCDHSDDDIRKWGKMASKRLKEKDQIIPTRKPQFYPLRDIKPKGILSKRQKKRLERDIKERYNVDDYDDYCKYIEELEALYNIKRPKIYDPNIDGIDNKDCFFPRYCDPPDKERWGMLHYVFKGLQDFVFNTEIKCYGLGYNPQSRYNFNFYISDMPNIGLKFHYIEEFNRVELYYNENKNHSGKPIEGDFLLIRFHLASKYDHLNYHNDLKFILKRIYDNLYEKSMFKPYLKEKFSYEV